MVTVYGIKNCNTVQKSLAFLSAAGVEFTFHDYKKNGLPEGKIKNWLNKEGWEKLTNKQGLTWKKLDESVKNSIHSADDAYRLFSMNASVIKRPILESPKGYCIGFSEETWTALI
ncbi:MAG: Spx/MgsR family RNA polymerase-binding regulatory protein [Bacteroidia bacterium]